MLAATAAMGYSILVPSAGAVDQPDCAGAASSAPKGEGLESLDDRTLGAELSGRGIGNLLDRYFTINRVPEYDEAVRSRPSARCGKLSGKNAAKIPYGEKLRRAREVASGIDAVLPTLKDPMQMMGTAAICLSSV